MRNRHSNSFNLTVIIYHQNCNKCNAFANFLRSKDRSNSIRIYASRSETGSRMLEAIPDAVLKTDSIFVFRNGRYYTRSAALSEVSNLMHKPWNLLYALRLLPFPVRESIYSLLLNRGFKYYSRARKCPYPEMNTHSAVPVLAE